VCLVIMSLSAVTKDRPSLRRWRHFETRCMPRNISIMDLEETEAGNDCAGEGQQQFIESQICL
jgi:hypothetical protein